MRTVDNKTTRPSFEFRRRIDAVVYRFCPCESLDGKIAWKREDIDLWVTQITGFGWVCVNSNRIICGIPWGVALDQVDELPPAGEWVSKKGDKSYVYDVVYIDA